MITYEEETEEIKNILLMEHVELKWWEWEIINNLVKIGHLNVSFSRLSKEIDILGNWN